MTNLENKPMYFLALVKRPGDYKFIDISKLNISNGFNPSSLPEIDAFTMQFSVVEIIDAIKDANIVEPLYQMGTLVIQDNQKHKPIMVIDKEFYSDFNIEEYFKERLTNKSLMNNIAYKFSTLVEDDNKADSFKLGIKTGNIDLVMNTIFSIDYLIIRKFIIYLIDLLKREKEKSKKQELIRDKAA